MLLQNCYLPSPVKDIFPDLQNQFTSKEENNSCPRMIDDILIGQSFHQDAFFVILPSKLCSNFSKAFTFHDCQDVTAGYKLLNIDVSRCPSIKVI